MNGLFIKHIVSQKYKFRLEKYKIKLAFLELEYGKDKDKDKLEEKLEQMKRELKSAKQDKNKILLLLFLYTFIPNRGFFRFWFGKKNKVKTDTKSFIEESTISDNVSTDKLLEKIDQIENK